MTLAAGARIGPYEIHSPLGAGGMGEVYRARDTKLARDVALKVLPDDVGHDAARGARFAREAQLLAALNHPHIAQIYGFEDSTETRALVMELVEGPTLADRLVHGAIPLDEALPIARQIAEALEAAHEQGIVHRDLKPANIKVRPDGTVKVLDFGLAKLLEPGSGIRDSGSGGAAAAPSMLPTVTSPAMMTGAGMILGTAAYMAPEQARGKDVDRRADIWAFGCVLYEMLTGRRLFAAEEVADTLAMVLTRDIDWTPLPASTPLAIRTLLRRCLEKDRKRRLPDIGVARLEIDEAIAVPAPAPAEAATATAARRSRVAWGIAAVATAAAVVLLAVHLSEAPAETSSPIRFSVVPPPGMRILGGVGEGQWLSPDGRHLAFRVTPIGTDGGPDARLAIRSFEAPDTRVLAGTEGASNAFWSPDSRFLAFFAQEKLQKIDITGGPAQVICDAPTRGNVGSTGGSWNRDGTIVFSVGRAQSPAGTGLFRVPAGGGTPAPLTTLAQEANELMHRHPWFLPDGRHFLYVATSGPGPGATHLHVGSLDGAPPRRLFQSDTNVLYADGFLIFAREDTLLAQRFNPEALELAGDPIVIAGRVVTNPATAIGAFSASGTGMLSYRTISSGGVSSQLTWFDRSGKVLGRVGDPIDQTEIHLSPDGTRVAASVLDATQRTRDIWIYDLARDGLRTRFTFDAGEDWSSAWSPDGRTLFYSAGRPDGLDLYQKSVDGSGAEQRLLDAAPGPNKYARSWSGDGRFLVYNSGSGGAQTGNDLWVLPLTGDRTPRPLLQTGFSERRGRFSPDGRWVAYQSNESGRDEIYVMPFGVAGGKWQISAAGGDDPKWRRDGRELFYVAGNAIMAAEVNGSGAAFQVGPVRQLFQAELRSVTYLGFGIGSAYDVTPDGQRLLANIAGQAQAASAPITVLTNWPATLR